jgi:hypothetical protein
MRLLHRSSCFFCYVVTPQKIEVDKAKIEANKIWSISATPTLQSFLGLVEFYQRFMRDFSTIATSLNDLMKKGVSFRWGAAQDQAFHTLINNKLTHTPLLQLLDFGKTFGFECDASRIGIGGVQLQEGKHMTYFSVKLSEPSLNYSTYDKELYTFICVLETWQHYFLT